MGDTSPDFVDGVRAEWARTYPAMDTSTIEVLGRINRISSLALHQLDRALAPRGVTRGDFEILCVLARAGRPLRASEVTSRTMTSGAATTKHADRLAKIGLLERLPFERDGRVVLLQLTAAGRELVDAELPSRVERDRRLLEGLDEQEQQTLVALLRRVSRNTDAASWPTAEY
ncbi:MarR family transcriptional regulator [Nocardia salmonicida]|uniref:MarR family winged helix-turn-helix transcriptional regulator n=1 Tax=Nocardia TaxID=1817 RepID=UPI002658D93D|nr:MarR family transcriptional regulator [Nocardia sp. PE-7]WKG06922.1 MarR family transcriptional regulator [Nocardia sp. PE-7]